MINKLRARMQDEKGFTLIELLVVILIIGILAAIALPAFLNQREKAQDSTAKSDVRTAQTAMETYYTDNQTYVGADRRPQLVAIEPALEQRQRAHRSTTPTATGYTISIDVQGLQQGRRTRSRTPAAPSPAPATRSGTGGCSADGHLVVPSS